jgi:hypothetical protein
MQLRFPTSCSSSLQIFASSHLLVLRVFFWAFFWVCFFVWGRFVSLFLLSFPFVNSGGPNAGENFPFFPTCGLLDSRCSCREISLFVSVEFVYIFFHFWLARSRLQSAGRIRLAGAGGFSNLAEIRSRSGNAAPRPRVAAVTSVRRRAVRGCLRDGP